MIPTSTCKRSCPRSGLKSLPTSGRGRVLAHEILASQLLVEMEDRRRVLVLASDVLTVIAGGSPPAPRGAPGDN